MRCDFEKQYPTSEIVMSMLSAKRWAAFSPLFSPACSQNYLAAARMAGMNPGFFMPATHRIIHFSLVSSKSTVDSLFLPRGK
jgi:hypothetical protein